MTNTTDNSTPARPLAQPPDVAPARAVRCKPASPVLQDRQLEPARIPPNRNPSEGAFMSQVSCLGLQSDTAEAILPGSGPLRGGPGPCSASLQEIEGCAVLQGRAEGVMA
jgi:hypothetical protein